MHYVELTLMQIQNYRELRTLLVCTSGHPHTLTDTDMQSPGTWSLRWTGSGDPWHPRSPCLPWCSPSSPRCIARRHWLQIHFQMVSASWYWVWHPRHPWLVLSIICRGEYMKKISLVQVDEGGRDINCLTLRCKVSLSTPNHSLCPGPRCCNGPV